MADGIPPPWLHAFYLFSLLLLSPTPVLNMGTCDIGRSYGNGVVENRITFFNLTLNFIPRHGSY